MREFQVRWWVIDSRDRLPVSLIVPIYLDAHTHATPHLTAHHLKTHDQDMPTALVHPEFCYSDVHRGPMMSDTPNATRYSPAEHDPGLAILVNSVKIELGGGKYNQIISKCGLEQYVAHVRTTKRQEDSPCQCSFTPWSRIGVTPRLHCPLWLPIDGGTSCKHECWWPLSL